MNLQEPKRKPKMPRFGHNICGMFVQTLPERLEDVARSLDDMPGVEIHERADDGRLVITIEDTPEQHSTKAMIDIQLVSGVIAASLVYHHCDTDTHPEEEKL